MCFILNKSDFTKIEKKHSLVDEKEYIWGTNDRLLSVIINGEHRRYEYDNRGFFVKTFFEDGSEQLRIPDDVGNLYESISRKDRSYGSGGRLERQGKWKYRYDDRGNLIKKSQFLGETWKYEWNSGGMLEKVIRPDKQEVTFKYDALGRRIEKASGNILTKWLWDGNVPLHEWKEYHIYDYKKDRGEFVRVEKQAAITWIFEEGTFVPVAKLTANGNQSIVTNYMGTPEAMYNSSGEQTWSCDLDSYGRVRKHSGNLCDCPWRYQGQFEDEETGLYYNRFRYYDSSTGSYLSQDPIGLAGNNPTLYAYVSNPNSWLDILGLDATYYPLDNLGRPTGGIAEVDISSLGTGTDAAINPPGWEGGGHPYHQQRGHLIANNHGGSGTEPRNIVTITDGTNHPGMTKWENKITKHVKEGNTVLVEVKANYSGDNLVPDSISIYAINQKGDVIVDATVDNGLRQNTLCCS